MRSATGQLFSLLAVVFMIVFFITNPKPDTGKVKIKVEHHILLNQIYSSRPEAYA